MNSDIFRPIAIGIFLASSAMTSLAFANTQVTPPICFTNRFGVEQCGFGENAPPPPPPPRTRADVAREALQQYCDEKKNAGRVDPDGLCAIGANPKTAGDNRK